MAVSVVRRARRLLGAAVAGAALLAALLGATAAVARAAPSVPAGRAAILFLPWSEAARGDRALLARLGERRRGLALGP
jgi:hypothetical protein